jgi:hypothetical protein
MKTFSSLRRLRPAKPRVPGLPGMGLRPTSNDEMKASERELWGQNLCLI